MKFAAAYYLLLIYATVIAKPVIPVIEDSVFHCFAEAYHIATVHAKYGSNHLQKQIANTNDDNTNNTNKNTLKEDNSVTLHIASIQQIQSYPINKLKKLFFIQPQTALNKIFIHVIFPPPKPLDIF